MAIFNSYVKLPEGSEMKPWIKNSEAPSYESDLIWLAGDPN